MNIRVFLVSLLAVLALSGCGRQDSSAGAAGGTASSGATAPAGGPRTIEITANDQMRFSVTAIEAKAGEELHVVLTNAGSLPKEAMAHNWVLLQAGNDPMAFSAAGAMAKDQGYIPDRLKDQVIASIPLQGPHQTGEVTFKAPAQPGEYPFLCSFPGHAALMKGTLTVR